MNTTLGLFQRLFFYGGEPQGEALRALWNELQFICKVILLICGVGLALSIGKVIRQNAL